MFSDKKNLILISILSLSFFSLSPKDDFVIKKEEVAPSNCSRDELKESIGDQIKDALNNCAELNKQIGKIQIELSEIQKQLFAKVEELIDNKRPFKKASTPTLNNAFSTISKVKNELLAQVETVKNLSNQLNKDECFKVTKS